MIADTHALRKLKTRLGASFCFALIVVFVALFIFVFGESNVSETVSLMPAGANITSVKLDDYGQLNITLRMVGPRLNGSSETCEGLVEIRPNDAFKCNAAFHGDAGDKNAAGFGTVSCTVHINCSAGVSIRGQEDLILGLPDRFQTIEWALWHEQWDGKETTSTMHHALRPKSGDNASLAVLAGSADDPTTLTFGVIRSVVHDNRNAQIDEGCATGGLQLSWRGVKRVQSTQGSAYGMHYIGFRFLVEEFVFRKNLETKLSFTNRLSVVITYCLTVIGVMNSVKSNSKSSLISCTCIAPRNWAKAARGCSAAHSGLVRACHH